MIEEENDFHVWLVVSTGEMVTDYEQRHVYFTYKALRFEGGLVPDAFGLHVKGVYATEAEANANRLIARPADNRPDLERAERMYDEPVAWLICFVILMHESGDAAHWTVPAFGGELVFNDDREVIGVVAAQTQADELVARLNSGDARIL